MNTLPKKSELQAGVEKLAAESGGLLTMDAVRTCDLPHLLTDALFGDAEAQALVKPVMHVMSKVASAPKRRPMLCASCPRPLREGDKFAAVVVRGAVDDPTRAITMAVCRRCGPTLGAIKAAAAVGLRGVFPEARDLGDVDLKQPGGRA